MTIERVANHGIPYLRLTASLGLKRVGERVVQLRKVVLGLGLLSRHDDGNPDCLLRLRESFRAGKPLIKELEPYADGARRGKVTVAFDEGERNALASPGAWRRQSSAPSSTRSASTGSSRASSSRQRSDTTSRASCGCWRKDGDGKEKTVMRKLREKVVVYWSRSFCERERRENASFLIFEVANSGDVPSASDGVRTGT